MIVHESHNNENTRSIVKIFTNKTAEFSIITLILRPLRHCGAGNAKKYNNNEISEPHNITVKHMKDISFRKALVTNEDLYLSPTLEEASRVNGNANDNMPTTNGTTTGKIYWSERMVLSIEFISIPYVC